MTQSMTSSAGWIIAVSRALSEAGCDVQQLFEAAGLDLDQATDPNSRFPVEKMRSVWRAAVAQTNDEAIGLKVAGFVKPTSFHALGYAMLASATLREALVRVTNYIDMVSNSGVIVFEQGASICRLRFERTVDAEGLPVVADQALDAFMASVMLLCRELYRPDFAPLRVELERPDPVDSTQFGVLFGCQVAFSAEVSEIQFATSDLDRRLPTANAELAAQSDQVVMDYLARLHKDNVVGRVQAKIIDLLPTGEPAQERVAEALHMSLRSLQRKLNQEGTSYSHELDDVRQQLAQRYLQQSHLAVSEICFMLGFASLSSFSRAFKRWTGSSPVHYRSERLGLT